ncbi:MAG TPA: putative Ig domain-containing protein, partial [Steroidobacteraceae bacterium]|nr:putative Ig domain-containing protein [Steroidobacteraceae bacterium]
MSTSALPGGVVGQAYSTTLSATGGKTPYTWTVTSGTLPNGLTLGSTTGTISGTPTATASAPVTFKVQDSSSPQQSTTVTLTLAVVSPVGITTSSLPSALVGQAYSVTLAASGGTTPYSWSLSSGTLPSGLSLNGATGAISGTPTATASTALTFKVQDSSSPQQSATLTLTLAVVSVVGITTGSLPGGVVGQAYSATLAANGGTTPYTWSVASGTLPAGLSLNGSTGVISGTPTAAASAPITF